MLCLLVDGKKYLANVLFVRCRCSESGCKLAQELARREGRLGYQAMIIPAANRSRVGPLERLTNRGGGTQSSARSHSGSAKTAARNLELIYLWSSALANMLRLSPNHKQGMHAPTSDQIVYVPWYLFVAALKCCEVR